MMKRFRLWLANLISGGELTRLGAAYDADVSHYRRSRDAMMETAYQLSAALYLITAQETPKANATVRRMVAIAREALE